MAQNYSKGKRIARLLAPALLVTPLLAVPAISQAQSQGQNQAQRQAQTQAQAGMGQISSVNSVMRSPQSFANRSISVGGTVTNVLNQNAFVMNDQGASGNGILVVHQGQMSNLRAGTRVVATGVVDTFNRRTFGRELGVRFDGSSFDRYVDRPAILATSVQPWTGAQAGVTLQQRGVIQEREFFPQTERELAPRVGQTFVPRSDTDYVPQPGRAFVPRTDLEFVPVPPGTPGSIREMEVVPRPDVDLAPVRPGTNVVPRAGTERDLGVTGLGTNRGTNLGTGLGTNVATGRWINATVDEILDAPAEFIGQSVVIQGEVDEEIGRLGFTIEDNDLFFDEEILIIGARPWTNLGGWENANEVQVRGVVRWFDPRALQREFGIGLEQNSLYRDFEGQPVIVASAIDFGNGLVNLGAGTAGTLGTDRDLGVNRGLGTGLGTGFGTGFGTGVGVDRDLGVNRGLDTRAGVVQERGIDQNLNQRGVIRELEMVPRVEQEWVPRVGQTFAPRIEPDYQVQPGQAFAPRTEREFVPAPPGTPGAVREMEVVPFQERQLVPQQGTANRLGQQTERTERSQLGQQSGTNR